MDNTFEGVHIFCWSGHVVRSGAGDSRSMCGAEKDEPYHPAHLHPQPRCWPSPKPSPLCSVCGSVRTDDLTLPLALEISSQKCGVCGQLRIECAAQIRLVTRFVLLLPKCLFLEFESRSSWSLVSVFLLIPGRLGSTTCV